LKADRTQVKTK